MTDPVEKTAFDETYFNTGTYANVSFGKYSQYWWSNRFYSILAKRYARSGSRLLEIGCGLGHLVGQLEENFSTYGIDVNHAALRDTAKKIAPRTHLDIASAQELPFASGSFGVVVIKHVVEHLPDPGKAIQELGRVLAPGGILVLSTPNLDSYGRKWKGSRWIGYQDKTHISLKPPAEWLDLIQNTAKLRVLKSFSDGFWDVPYISWMPAGLQKLIFGSFGGFQAISGIIFLPIRLGESIIVISQKPE